MCVAFARARPSPTDRSRVVAARAPAATEPQRLRARALDTVAAPCCSQHDGFGTTDRSARGGRDPRPKRLDERWNSRARARAPSAAGVVVVVVVSRRSALTVVPAAAAAAATATRRRSRARAPRFLRRPDDGTHACRRPVTVGLGVRAPRSLPQRVARAPTRTNDRKKERTPDPERRITWLVDR